MIHESFGEEHRQYTEKRPQYTLAMMLLGKIPQGGRVLDVGSGLGEFSDVLSKKPYDVFGVEGVKDFVSKQLERGLKVYQVNLESEKLPFEDNSFDIAVSLDVIEHLWNTSHYLGEINRCIKPGGFFIVSTINYNYWKYRWLHIRGKMEYFVFQSRHKKFYTLNSLERELSALFEIQDVAYHNGKSVVRQLLRPNFQALQFAFLCRPKKI